MPKKNLSPTERQAWGAKMKAARTAAQLKRTAERETPSPEELQHPVPGTSVKMDGEDITGLRQRVEELSKQVEFLTGTKQQPEISSAGRLIGTFDKFIVDPKWYPDPTERLAKEVKLQRFAFGSNYELSWNVTSTQYQTLDGVNTREPKFTIELIRRMLDEDTGEDTGKRFVVCRAIFHEDPQAAITIAREKGLNIDDYNERNFLDEMRYLRIRDWLLEAFYPPKPAPMSQKKEMVIGNRLVEVYTVNSEETQTIPFHELTKKL